ncbi:hydrogenase expression/formation protein [candidate division KSB1 bacterium]|nr:hydrogenase expression/formation protein [candidate division KSB1 bacterium]
MTEKTDFLPLGKMSPQFLGEMIKKYTTGDDSIIIGPKVGVDAAVINFGDQYLIAKTDPITFVTDDIGYYAININANDIACMGGVPKWFLGTLLLPEAATTQEMVEDIFSQVNQVCCQLKISFCGGHTEVTYGINRPILIGQMLGEVKKDLLIKNENAQPGDDILLTKGIAIEATSIIAREKEEKLTEIYSADLVEKCKNFIYQPGISILREAQIAVKTGGVKAMHDPTEGGLAMGLHELANAAGCGMKIFEKEIPKIPEAKLLCDQYDINIFGVIASGALLIVTERKSSHKIIESLKEKNILAKKIGKIMEPGYGIKLISEHDEIDFPEFYQDEITKLFGE